MIRLTSLVVLLFATTLFAQPAHSQSTEAAAVATENVSTPAAESSDAVVPGEKVAAFSLDDLDVESVGATKSAWVVLPFAFIAGFLLNFMPCVLPVVGLKLLSFVQQAQSDRKRILLMNLSYTAGLVSVMLVLASLAVFAGLGWGEQFSSSTFTIALAVAVFAFGLSFLGVWEIPLPGFVGSSGGKATQEGYAGAFSKGILSTLLATPCSGPFLGAALAWALKQPPYVTYVVFVMVGLGMASPYLVIGAFPSLIRFLPKPGNWMNTFKHLMGFVMLATVVYLLSFVSIASVVPTVLLLLGIGMAVWYAGQTPLTAERRAKVQAWGIAAAIVAATTLLSFGWLEGVMQSRFERAAARLNAKAAKATLANNQSGTPAAKQVLAPANSADDSQADDAEATSQVVFDAKKFPATTSEAGIVWREYTPELLEAAIAAGRPVFVDFTADWCLTCKSNEAAAVETEAFSETLQEYQVVALRADKTEPNADADGLLKKLGNKAASIPFYAFFDPTKPADPIVMDGIHTSNASFVDDVKKSSYKTPATDSPVPAVKVKKSAEVVFDAKKFPATTSEAGIVWREYTPELLETAIAAGRPVFVDFTADWCLTCKSNEAAAVETAAFSETLKNHQVVALRADKTEPNEDADVLLKKLGNKAASIPFYAFFDPNNPGDPIVMDGIHTSNASFVDAVKKSSQN